MISTPWNSTRPCNWKTSEIVRESGQRDSSEIPSTFASPLPPIALNQIDGKRTGAKSAIPNNNIILPHWVRSEFNTVTSLISSLFSLNTGSQLHCEITYLVFVYP